MRVENIAVTGVNWAEYRDRDPEWVQRVQAELFDMVADGKMRAVQAVYTMTKWSMPAELSSTVKSREK